MSGPPTPRQTTVNGRNAQDQAAGQGNEVTVQHPTPTSNGNLYPPKVTHSPVESLSSDVTARPTVPDNIQSWDEGNVSDWLKSIKCGTYTAQFTANNINGEALLECNQTILKEMGITKVGDRIRIDVAIKGLRHKSKEGYLGVPATAATTAAQAVSPTESLFRSAGRPLSTIAGSNIVSPLISPRPANETQPLESHHQASSSIDNSNVMSIDTVKQNCVKFIGDNGQTRIVNIIGCHDAGSILKKALKKFNIQDDYTRWCVFIITEKDICRRLSDSELVFICLEPSRLERERLILCRRHRQPTPEEVERSGVISREQQQAIAETYHTISKKRIDQFFGDNNRVQKPPVLPPASVGISHFRGSTTKRIRNFFGQRPPSELISSNLSEYFPGHEKGVLEETVRNSIRRSARFGPNGRRLSVSTTSSYGSSMKDVPPLPSITDNWHYQTFSPIAPQKVAPSRPPRPTSLRRVVPSDSISRVPTASSIETNHISKLPTASPQPKSEFDDGSESDGKSHSPAADVSSDDASKVESILEDRAVTASEESTIDDEYAEGEEGLEEDDYDENGPSRWIKGALIGQGSFGTVYLGMNALNGVLMAVKQVEISQQEARGERRKLEALQREILLLRDLQHENIVTYLGSSTTDDKYLNIFLEYVPGGSVTAFLAKFGPFEETLTCNFIRQILAGLMYLHDRDIVHRDIKGANILIDNKGNVKISDFGLSKRVEANLLSMAQAHRPSFQGSAYWMAPEVVKQTSYTKKADIWSLGCLILEMFTGKHPFPEYSQMQAIFKVLG